MLLPRLTRILRLRWTGLAGLCRLTQTATSPTLETTKVHPESPIGNFQSRHIGPSDQDAADMLKFCGYRSMDELISKAIPDAVRLKRDLCLEEPMNEFDILKRLEKMMNKNQVWRSYIGQGYYGTITPTPIIRNIFENPGWYTSYTPYQPEISQGRLEALLNFQTVVSELTGLPVANASLLDEGTAAAEAISMAYRVTARSKVLVDSACHPQTIDVVRSRANGLDFEVQVLDFKDTMEVEKLLATDTFAACLMQYPDTEGNLHAEMVSKISEMARKHKTLSVVATDLLALTLVRSPGELGADVAIGSAQRFGVPMGFGGPHAAFFATRQEFVRAVPGRVVGISKDSHKRPALRLALQVREQHIRRDKATSNICTAQALLANMASFYAVYHGPQGLRDIASRVHRNTIRLAASLILAKYEICSDGPVFDTLKVRTLENLRNINTIKEQALQKRINLRYYPDEQSVGISLDQTVTDEDFMDILYVFDAPITTVEYESNETLEKQRLWCIVYRDTRTSSNQSINKSSEDLWIYELSSYVFEGPPCSWPTVNSLHPFVPAEQTQGYEALIHDLEQDLAEVTGYDHVCLAPNSGAQGEYAGLCAIARFLKSRGEIQRKVGLCRPGDLGTDVCHLNLHKTFSIPHGGGGPGIGPICVKEHLAPFLPQHAWRNPCLNASHMLSTVDSSPHTVCSAPFGSASLLLIPWSYIKLLGPKGVRKASETAILNANYMLQRLRDHYPIKFVNKNGCCAHEFIVDCSSFEKHRIFTIDIAKRLIDY
ncbi:glycine dehydrogenase, partial [Opisthorchis viverrini]